MHDSWLAGFIDGEGCLDISKQSRTQLVIRLTITNTHLVTLKEIQALYGGRLSTKITYSNKHTKAFTLTWSGNKSVVPLLQRLQPYFKVKKSQVDFVLATWVPSSVGQGRRYTNLQKEARLEMKTQLMKLKKSSCLEA